MRRFALGALALASAVGIAPVEKAWAETPVPMASSPEEVGLSSVQLKRIEAVTEQQIKDGLVPGAVMLVARRGKVAWVSVQGKRDPAQPDPMKLDSIFRIYSMTKPIVSTTLMQLVEEGRLQISDPVSKYLPEIGNMKVGTEVTGPDGKPLLHLADPTRPMTVQDLLRHTSGLTYGNRGTTAVHQAYPQSSSTAAREMTIDQFVERQGKAPLLFQPGTRWEYGFSTDVLARVVEVVSGQPIGQFLAERLFRPLKMADTGFVVPAASHARIAQALSTDPDTGKAVSVPDVTVAPKFECGGGCVVSTAGDYVRFSQMLLNRGSLDGIRVLGRKTVEYMTADHLSPAVTGAGDYLPGAGYGFGLGFAVRREAGLASATGTAGEYSWGGAFGTMFWVDPREQLVVVSMTQAPGPIRVHYRQLLKSFVLQAIDD
jgi:CubicO group peptidase (beta-lactamase class C family)